MKKLALLMACALVFALAGCSDDDKIEGLRATDIAGQYEGYTNSNSDYFSDRIAEGESLTIAANADNTINLTFESSEWGTYELDNLAVTLRDGALVFSGQGSVTIAGHASSADYPYTMTGTAKSTTDAEIVFTIPALMGGTVITFRTGEVPKE